MRAGRLKLTNEEHHLHVSDVLICNEKQNCHKTKMLMLVSLMKSFPGARPTWGEKSQSEFAETQNMRS